MKQLWKMAVVVSMIMLVAAQAPAQRAGGRGGAHPRGMVGGGQGGAMRGPAGHGGGGMERGPGRFIEKLLEPQTARKLELKPAQITALETGIKMMEQREETLHHKLQKAAKTQAQLLSAEGDVDEEALMRAIEKTGALRTEMAKLRVEPILLVRRTLTEEQIKRSREMMAARREKWTRQRGRQTQGGRRPGRKAPRPQWNDDAEDQPAPMDGME